MTRTGRRRKKDGDAPSFAFSTNEPNTTPGDPGADVLKAYMRDLTNTPRMNGELELELGQKLESSRREIAEALAGSRAAGSALVALRALVRRDPALVKRYFLPAGPDEDAKSAEERANSVTELLDRLAEAFEVEASGIDELICELRLTDQGLSDVLRRWPAEDEQDRQRQAAIEAARARLSTSRRRLVEANLRLVLWELGKTPRSGVDVEDLIQEGNFALLRAAELYDPARDVRFSSYAIWWIRARIKRAIQQRHAPVRLPLHVQRRLSEIRSKTQRLAIELGREPTLSELSERVGLDPETTRQLLARASSLEAVSLQAPASDQSAAALENALPDPNGVTALDALVERELAEWLRENLDHLTERERTVLTLRFGFDEQERELSLAEIAREFGLSRERVRQIETVALRRLCSGSRRAELVARCDSSRAPALKKAVARVEDQLRRMRKKPRRDSDDLDSAK